MKKLLSNIIQRIGIAGIIISFIILLITSCSDNLDDLIKEENKYTDNSGNTEDDLPIVLFASSTSRTLNEDENEHAVDIILSKASADTVTITVSDALTGSATSGTDYNYTGWTPPQVITFSPGETNKTVSITPIQDAIDEGTGETIILQLSSQSNALLGTSTHLITIADYENWEKLDEISNPRAGAAMALYGDWIYVYSGENSTGVLNSFWRYNLLTGEYQILTPVGARAYATLVELNSKLYLFSGKINASGTLLYNDKLDGLFYYDLSSSTWYSFKGSDTNGTFPDARAHHVAVPLYVYDLDPLNSIESIYFQGGKDATGTNLTGDIHELDSVPLYEVPAKKRTWSSVSIAHTRSEHSAVYYNNNIYFFGGYNSGTYYNDLWKFDITGPDFDEVIPIGITIVPVRSGISMIEHNGKLYVFGGKNDTDCFDDLWSYSVAGNTWTKISTAPFKRCFYSAVKYNNSLIIFGGYYLNSLSQKVYSSEIWQYSFE